MYKVPFVDDDPELLSTNGDSFTARGYQVFLAQDAGQAVGLAASAALNCIVLDVEPPNLDGMSVCARIWETSNVPIIFLSAYAREDDRIKGLLAGGDDYVAKPYNLVELELRGARPVRPQQRPRTSRLSSLVPLCASSQRPEL